MPAEFTVAMKEQFRRIHTLLHELLTAHPATTSVLFTNIYSGSFASLRSFIFNKLNILNPS